MAEDFIWEMKQMQPNLPGEWYQLAIVARDSGKLMGDIAYYLLKRDPRQAEIGITIARAYHKKGYAQEATRRLLAYLFDERKIHRVQANCDVDNRPAWELLEQLGFRAKLILWKICGSVGAGPVNTGTDC